MLRVVYVYYLDITVAPPMPVERLRIQQCVADVGLMDPLTGCASQLYFPWKL